MARTLKTVSQYADLSPFSEPSLRWMIFQAKANGLQASGALVRVGRRVYLDPDKFDAWIDAQQSIDAGGAANDP